MKSVSSFYYKVFFCLLVAVIIIFGGSRSFGYEWSKTYGPFWGRSGQQTNDGGYIITGESDGSPDCDMVLIKTDTDGEALWRKTYAIIGGCEVGASVQQTNDGGYIIAGWEDFFNTQAFLIKTDADGNEQWNKVWGGVFHSVQQTTEGGYIIGGTGRVPDNGGWSPGLLLIKTDSDGNELWSKVFRGGTNSRGISVQQTSDAGYILVGQTTTSFTGVTDVYAIKTDGDGNELWSKTFGGSEFDGGYSVQQTTDGGFIIAGYTYSFGAGQEDVYLIKTDADGNELWSKTFGGSYGDRGCSVQQTTDGGYIIAGNIGSRGNPWWNEYIDVYLIKTDADGNEQWNKTFGGSQCDTGYSVQQTTDGGYIIAGKSGTYQSSEVYLIYYKPTPKCDGKESTIVGTEGHDVINGTAGPDVIHGLGGNDVIHGLGGADVICGGDGHDVIDAGSGYDTVLGENGHDAIWGSWGFDTLLGGDGNDTIYGGPGNDLVGGHHGNDSLYGEIGSDRLVGGWGPNNGTIDNNDTCYDTAGTFTMGCEVFYEQ